MRVIDLPATRARGVSCPRPGPGRLSACRLRRRHRRGAWPLPADHISS